MKARAMAMATVMGMAITSIDESPCGAVKLRRTA
jgi:hypothetical protein